VKTEKEPTGAQAILAMGCLGMCIVGPGVAVTAYCVGGPFGHGLLVSAVLATLVAVWLGIGTMMNIKDQTKDQ